METISISTDRLETKHAVLRGRLADVEGDLDALIAPHIAGRQIVHRERDEHFDVISNDWHSRLRVTLLKD